MRTNGKPAAITPQNDQGNMPGGSIGEALIARGATMSRMQIGDYQTAVQVQKARELKVLQARVVEEAQLLGQDFMYGWEVNDKNAPNGKGWIEGVSIDGAMILARNWGNCATPVKLVEDAPTYWILEATFVDLETGYTVQRLFRQRKTESHSKSMEADRKLDIAFQIGQSKAQRNVIVKAMPAWLINAAKEAALSSTVSKYEQDLPKFRKIAIGAFAKIGATQAMLERKVGLPVDAWTARDLARLSSLHKAITEEKVISVADAFAEKPAEDQKPADGQQTETQPTSDGAEKKAAPTEATSDGDPEDDSGFGS